MKSPTLVPRGSCPLCRSTNDSAFLNFPEIPVVQCGTCGFLYSSRVLAGDDLAAYYQDGFGSLRHRQGQRINAMINAMVLSRLVHLGEVSTALDVGTGYGFLLKELCRRKGLQATGVELSTQEAEFANNTLGVNVINAPLGDAGLKTESYDLVTSFEVLEHVPHPVAFLSELADYVRPGGYLVVMTDNFGSRMAQSLGAGFPKWIPHSHISHFSDVTLRRVLTDIDRLEVVKAVSFTPWEILLRNLVYKIRGIRRTPAEAFNLETSLQTEMRGSYRCFTFRRLFNRLWARCAISSRMDGDLIYFICKKTGSRSAA